ncbi:MAG: histidine phosphatase family protein [Pirellulaceae bacterium]|nr:histidine phosphatase family protein [Pirellulaceae bacterium]MDP7015631.1 histidine phosphatase family protein [Pirellulaceae bacterium]
MKTLLILRHAKSSWANADQSDHDRPLNQRGKRDAPRIGALIADRELTPDRVVCSTAVRAMTTAQLIAQSTPLACEVELDESLYLAPPSAYLEVMLQTADDVDCLMVVGHNPGIEELVEKLTGEDETMPTGALAVVHLAIDNWTDAPGTQRAELQHVLRPKEVL